MKTIFITVAYNAEKTIQRTIESILGQSHPNFVYYIADNGSTDRTGEILRKYSQIDSRIVVISKSKNNIWLFFEILPDILKNYDKTDYLCSIDADDTYNYNFLEKMLAFIEKERLDIAACGNDFIDSETKRINGVRKLGKNLVLDGCDFVEYFPHYYQFMRTIWGKVYSLSVLLEDKFEPRYEMGYGGDTIFAIEAFRRAKRVGILAESLHGYYLSQKSASFQFNVKRIVSDRILFDVASNFLLSKARNVSTQNEDFLLRVYFYALLDTLNVLLNAQMSVSYKLANLLDIFQSQHTQELIKWTSMVEEKSQLFSKVSEWVLIQKQFFIGKDLDTAITLLAEMGSYIPKKEGWRDDEIFALLLNIREKSVTPDVVDGQIVALVSKSPLLARLDVGFLIFFQQIVNSILQNDEQKALTQIEETIIQEINIPDKYVEALMLLGLNLSAKLEYADDFVYFKKLQILHLINFSRTYEAREELADWDDMLPNDMDFKELRARLK